MGEPAIVAWGRDHINDYSPEEFRESLIRAFRDKRTKFIVLDSNMRGQKFLAAGIAWGIDQGLLYNDINEDAGQQVISSFRLTEKGEKEIRGQS